MSYAEALLRMDTVKAEIKEHCHQKRPAVEFFCFKKMVWFCSHADKLLILFKMTEVDLK